MQLLFGMLLLLAIVVGAAAITMAGVSLIRRNREKLRGSGSLGTAMQELESLFVESKGDVVEVERAEDAEEEASAGDPPEKK